MVIRRHITALAFVCLCVGASAQVPLNSLDTTVAVQNDGSAIVVERFSSLGSRQVHLESAERRPRHFRTANGAHH